MSKIGRAAHLFLSPAYLYVRMVAGYFLIAFGSFSRIVLNSPWDSIVFYTVCAWGAWLVVDSFVTLAGEIEKRPADFEQKQSDFIPQVEHLDKKP